MARCASCIWRSRFRMTRIWPTCQLRAGEAPEVLEHRGRDRLSAKIPDDRAQLRVDVEAEAVVDAVDLAVRAEQAVAALPVGVVRDEIEEADPLEAAVMRGVLAQS